MKDSILISTIIILIYIFLFINKSNLKLVEYNNENVLVRDLPNSHESVKLLGTLIKRMYLLRNYIVSNKSLFSDHLENINLLERNFNRNRTLIYENTPYSDYTSYSVNKGEEFVFCLRCKKTNNLHNINLLVYVAVHEMAHAGCKEIGHTPLFNKIFRFYLEKAIELGFYCYENYSINPVNYCGMDLYTNILNSKYTNKKHFYNCKETNLKKCKCYNI